MKITLTQEEVTFAVAAYLIKSFGVLAKPDEVTINTYSKDYALWEPKQLPEPDDSKYMKRKKED